MNSAYRELEKIWRGCHKGGNEKLQEVIPLLASHGTSLRKKDGTLKQINLSIPNTRDDAYVVGLRYIKNDGTCTEDHFLCERDTPEGLERLKIACFPKRKLEDELPEYKGAHKQQVAFSQTEISSSVTDVSTLSYTGSFSNNGENS